MKTQAQIDDLKAQWKADPCWDIEDTEGFEDHKHELLKYRLEIHHAWAKKVQARLEEKAKKLGCPVELVKYIEMVEYDLRQLKDKVYRELP